ncbi:MAG: class I SAM-dependent methyltransferase family protein [Archaeoglobaceae archaeon]|nr:class I SAM-dependent methyltransferase family protein [Archaeoglobaceae archaeon]MDW8127936.1 class I SAM-dependent methyltransferase family protein [Archaeoglobaceae archaeon]
MSLKEMLKDKLSEEELKILRRSFEIIGDIAIIEIPDELMSKKELIADAILKKHKQIKTILRKVGEVDGIFRVARYEKIYGEKTETMAKEHGCRFLVDPTKVYFSSKLSTERERIARLVKEGERVLVMFAGVGPYAIVISKLSKAKEIVGVELNRIAVEYFRKNVQLNKVENVVVIEGDVAEVVPKLEGKFDRILMPAPYSAENFVYLVRGKVNNGGFVHYYTFESENYEEEIPKKVEEIFLKNGILAKVIFMRRCGSFAPYVNRYAVDVQYLGEIK